MNGLIQLLVLAGIAVFLILRLRSVLGTREGFENPPVSPPTPSRPHLELVENEVDRDIDDHIDASSPSGRALAAMKSAEPGFGVGEFLSGARGAYEMILMGFEKGKIAELRPFLAPEVYDGFSQAIEQRVAQGLSVDATFVGISALDLVEARFDPSTRMGELVVRFTAELTSVVRNAQGEIVEGDPTAIVKQRDTWTFEREMGASDPNWQLVATEA